MDVKDSEGRTVLSLRRALRCQSCWFPCFMQAMTVESAQGETIATIEQTW